MNGFNSILVWKLIFWILVATAIYTYLGHTLLIPIFGLFFKRSLNRKDIEPRVTFLITAHNEERNIRRKLEETLALDYRNNKLELIVEVPG